MADGEIFIKELDERYSINFHDLYRFCDPDELGFFHTGEIPPSPGIERIIGQERHLEEIKDGIKTKKPTYNVLICGEPGTGKSLAAKIIAEKIANDTHFQNVDQVAWFNFDETYEPHVMLLPAGMGKKLRSDMRRFITNFRKRLIDETGIGRMAEDEEKDLLERFNSRLEKYGFKPVEKLLPCGHKTYVPEPKDPGFKNLLDDARSRILKRVTWVTSQYRDEKERNYATQKKKVEDRLLKLMMGELKEKYKDFPQVINFLDEVEDDIKTNIDRFYPDPKRMEMIGATRYDEEFPEYKVKLLVDNSEVKGMPYRHVQNPTFSKLFGSVQWESFGLRGLPPHHRLKAGELIKCNRGMVVIDEGKKVVYDPRSGFVRNEVRDFLLTALQEQEVKIGSGSGFYTDTGQGIESEPCEAKAKVILCANRDVEELINLPENQPLKRRFKKIITFDSEMENTLENRRKYARFVADEIREYNGGEEVIKKEKIPPFSKEAVARLIEYGSYDVGKDKLTLKLDYLADVVVRAGRLARTGGKGLVEPGEIREAIRLIRNERNYYERHLLEAIERGKVLIGNEKEQGTVNGLAYVEKGTHFGIPLRIVATVTRGDKYLNIEKVASKSGSTFTKAFEEGISLLHEYYGSLNRELKANIRLSISQHYEGIEGPSAGAAEIDAIITAIGRIPVYPNNFLTGAIDPKSGKVLPIGGVNEKVKAAYYACKARGEEGTVIIPKANVVDLQIDDEELIEAVKAGRFRIYYQDHYTDGLEAITRKNKKYIQEKVKENLEKLRRLEPDERPKEHLTPAKDATY